VRISGCLILLGVVLTATWLYAWLGVPLVFAGMLLRRR
jgi:hypothetical protein